MRLTYVGKDGVLEVVTKSASDSSSGVADTKAGGAVPTVVYTTSKVVITSAITHVQDDACKGNGDGVVEGLMTGDRDTDKALQSTAFLWKLYKPSLYYFEVVECGRRLLLTGGIVFIAPGTAAQAASACMLAFVSMIIAMMIRPHKDPTDGIVYMAGCFNTVLSTFLSVCMKVDISKEASDSQKAFDVLLVMLNGFIVLAVLVHMAYLSHRAVARVQSFRSKRLSISGTTTETESATVETPSPAAAAISN